MAGKQPKRTARTGVDEYGRTPLHYAALDGDLATCVMLLDSSTSIDEQDDNGWTALHFAAQDGRLQVVEELLRRGADPSLTNAHGNGPLFVAIMNARGDFNIAKQLLAAGADPDQKNLYGRSLRDVADAMGARGDIGL